MNTTILVVDDIEANRFSLESLFEEYLENVDILLASSGEEALEIVYDKNVDLIILDIQMPGLDGFETAKFIKENPKTNNIPIIFLTAAYKKEEFRQKGFKLGAIDYLTKPIDNDQLINKLRLYIEIFAKNKEILEKEKLMITQSRQAAIGEILGMIAHQWRQPLSIISTVASGMEMNLEFENFNKNEFIESCKEIEDTTQKLSKIINKFSDSFKQDEKKKEFCINDILLEIHSVIDSTLNSKNIKLVKDLKAEKKVKVYGHELKQVIVSIIINAVEIISERKIEKPVITLKSWDEERYSYFEICDNAQGVKKENINKIFEPYFSTKDEKNGVGLGLYMSRFIISKHHNGKIEAINTEKGVCFRIAIPIS
ncbi:MAG: hybrid sensor histidine kinase/response regulator [Arcobacteraceae bacterium]|nr:hybrid sensor histidine kinase/response regulator [Arcobacteraceae bacterium]